MCGRYASTSTRADLLAAYDAVEAVGEELAPSYNIAPTQQVNVVQADRAWCITNDVDPHFATIGASVTLLIASWPTSVSMQYLMTRRASRRIGSSRTSGRVGPPRRSELR